MSSGAKRQNAGILYVAISTALSLCVVYYLYTHKEIRFAIWSAFFTSTSVLLWNFALGVISTWALQRMYLTPVWNFVFIDNSKLGQKIEWYNADYRHLTPEVKKLFYQRFGVVFGFAMFVYVLFMLPGLKGYGLSFADFFHLELTPEEAILSAAFSSGWINALKGLLVFATYHWVFTLFEVNTRIIARILDNTEAFKTANLYKKRLPDIPFDPFSPSPHLCFASYFVDKNGKPSLTPTNYEKWLTIEEKALYTNIMCYGPSGEGKTTDVIRPIYQQFMAWQASNPELKASGVIFDFKTTLLAGIYKDAASCGREDDIIELSVDKGRMNFIGVPTEELWDEVSHSKIAGWVTGTFLAWQQKENSDPFWSSSCYLIATKLIPIICFQKLGTASMYDISTYFLEVISNGCFRSTENKKIFFRRSEVFAIAKIVSTCQDVSIESAIPFLDEYEFEDITNAEVTQELIDQTKIRIEAAKRRARAIHCGQIEASNPEIIELQKRLDNIEDKTSAPAKVLLVKISTRISDIAKEIVEKEFKDINHTSLKELSKTAIIIRAIEHQKEFKAFVNSAEIYGDACRVINKSSSYFINEWSNKAPDVRSGITATVQPFLMIFHNEKLRNAISCDDGNVSIADALNTGKIIVPNFSSLIYGDGTSNAIFALFKCVWQGAVLASPNNKRFKFQIMDECQRIITFSAAAGIKGDFDFFDISREFKVATILATQSSASLQALAPSTKAFDKSLATVQTYVCLPLDKKTASDVQDFTGESIVNRISHTVTEGAQAPDLDAMSEKFKGDSSMQIGYTVSEQKEKKVSLDELMYTPIHTGIGLIKRPKGKEIVLLAYKPVYWPDRREKYNLMDKYDFNEGKREIERLKSTSVVFDFIKFVISRGKNAS